ncbi:hypothetical protein AB0F05_34810 [Streptomyces microflavus]|uniref:hypothetical protein n=1 Tax=Streptomyces microflavus TaxID=1919 RepID=UPI0033E87ADD
MDVTVIVDDEEETDGLDLDPLVITDDGEQGHPGSRAPRPDRRHRFSPPDKRGRGVCRGQARMAGGTGESRAVGGGPFDTTAVTVPWEFRSATAAAYPADVVGNPASATCPPRSVMTATWIVSAWEFTAANTASSSVAGAIVTVILSAAFPGPR